MKLTIPRVYCAFVLAVFAGFFVAQQSLAADPPPAKCDGLKVGTGPKGKGFSKLYTDVADVCGAKVNICEVNSDGALDNVSLLAINKVDVAFAMEDSLKIMGNSDENIRALRTVLPLNMSYLHIVVSAAGTTVVGDSKYFGLKKENKVVRVTKFSELKGLPVGLVGSTSLQVRKLNETYNMGMQIFDFGKDDEAFAAVKAGKIMAAFTISGASIHGAVNKLTSADGLTLAPFDYAPQQPYALKKVSYRGLGIYGTDALVVQNYLVSRPFVGKKTAQVEDLKKCLLSQLNDLKDGDYEPAWKEVK
jgi:TRAP-type uncharacterized transport system substrate-binding protein